MPRRLLTSLEREQLFALPRDDGALLRIATLSREHLAFIGQHRGDHNRLGVAIQLSSCAICVIPVGCSVLTMRLTRSSSAWSQLSSESLLVFGTSMPNAIRRGASIYKRSWNASALSNSIGSRIERWRSGYCRPRCKRRKVSSLLRLPLRSSEGVVSSCRRFW